MLGVWSRPRAPTRKTEEAVDHRQNNDYVKAVGTSPMRSNKNIWQLLFQLLCGVESNDNVRSIAAIVHWFLRTT